MKKSILMCFALSVVILVTTGANSPLDLSILAAGRSYQAGGVARVDTVRVLSRVSTFPNVTAITTLISAGRITAADTAAATKNSAADGSTVRWGWVSSTTADSVRYTSNNQDYVIYSSGLVAEDDIASWGTGKTIGYLWFSTSGLSPGMRVNRAYIAWNSPAFTTTTINAGQYIMARLDTVSADYAVLDGSTSVYGNTDVARFDITWNHVYKTGAVAWSPTMANRLDRHDWGPRSDSVIGAGSYAAGTTLHLDVTDAVQQVVDNARYDSTLLSRGVLFMIYGNSSMGTFAINAGNTAGFVGATNGKGCPIFYVEAQTRRGAMEWNGAARVPLVFTPDDQYPVQSSYFTAMEDNGLIFATAVFRNAVNAYSWVDSLYSLKPSQWYLIHHTRTHASIGTLTGDELDPEMARGWMLEEFTGLTAADTLNIVDWAWPGGGAAPQKSLEAASRLVDYGYRSARGAGAGWTAAQAAFEYETYLGWKNWVFPYQIKATGAAALFGVGSPNTEAQMAEELQDLVDLHYTDYGKAAIIVYGHRYDSAPADYISPAGLNYLIDYAATTNFTRAMDYDAVVSMRLNGSAFKTPAQVEVGRGVSADSNAIQTMAAHQDSAYAVDNDPNYLQMWLAPK